MAVKGDEREPEFVAEANVAESGTPTSTADTDGLEARRAELSPEDLDAREEGRKPARKQMGPPLQEGQRENANLEAVERPEPEESNPIELEPDDS